eukprot:5848331-Prymnesium_polylepis.1
MLYAAPGCSTAGPITQRQLVVLGACAAHAADTDAQLQSKRRSPHAPLAPHLADGSSGSADAHASSVSAVELPTVRAPPAICAKSGWSRSLTSA